MAQGVLLIVCGPSGVGKSTLCGALLDDRPRLTLSVSYTTRDRRGDEVDGEAYHFVSERDFLEMRDAGAFAEWAEVHGNFYGTSREVIEDTFRQGKDLLFDIDYQGARQLRTVYPDSTAVLVAPPDMETLEERLRGRGTDSEEVIQRRLAAARHELSQYELFDYVVENGAFKHALSAFRAIYDAAQHGRSLRKGWMEELLNS